MTKAGGEELGQGSLAVREAFEYSFDPPLREPNFRWYSVLLANQARETVRK